MSKSTKRKRPQGSQLPRKRHQAVTKSSGIQPGQVVGGDALRWQEVSLSGRLEDAEGFYGLEEIDGVEIVKDTGTLMFRPHRSEAVLSTPPEDEWFGFADDINESTPVEERVDEFEELDEFVEPNTPTSSPENSSDEKLQQDDLDLSLPFTALDDLQETTQVDVSAWKALALSSKMLESLSSLNFAKPTPIQAQAIPAVMDGKDVVGKAVTGSGKTLAFGIPILEKWLETTSTKSPVSEGIPPIALILAPTRELAHQLSKHISAVGKGLDKQPRIATVTGGLSVLKQQRQLETADIVIGTPGRLWEVMGESTDLVDRLKNVKFLVIDEADRLLTEGHYQELSDILDALDRKVVDEDDVQNDTTSRSARQTLVFSATFHKGLQQKLAGKTKNAPKDLLSPTESIAYLLRKLNFRSKKPIFIDASPASQMSVNLNESLIECPAMSKDLYLYALMLQHASSKTLVFTNSISSVRRLTSFLQSLSQPALAIHSTMPQKSRLRSLEKFTARTGGVGPGTGAILIATDVAARGLDVKAIDLIVHYHVPRTADTYVHRSGRTARADATGQSILLCSPDEIPSVTRLTAKIHAGKAPRTMSMDRRIISRLEPRVRLAQRITEATQAKEKTNSQDNWVRKAAEDLGVDYDSDEFEKQGKQNRRGRGAGNEAKQKQSAEVGKHELGVLRAQLRGELEKRINLGVSERYIAGGGVDMNALVEGRSDPYFLGM